jgi:hypothetical protein
MAPRHCVAPGCGRFVAANTEHCARHENVPAANDDVLAEEIRALRHVLGRLLEEVKDIDTLARHVPRVSGVAIQAARAQHQIGARGREELAAVLRPMLADLDEEGRQ